MRKRFLPNLILLVFILSLFFTSCTDDKYLLAEPPIPDQSFVEEFDTVSTSLSKGWVLRNTSTPMVPTVWQQAGDVIPWFPAYSSNGSYVGYIGANGLLPVSSIGIISNWLISPAITMQNGDTLTFYTRALTTDLFSPGDSSDLGNRLQVKLNSNNDGVSVGVGIESGDFTTPLLDINPTYKVWAQSAPDPTAYPVGWTRFSAVVYGLAKPAKGRFAFRYLIEDGTTYGSGIAIDRVMYKSVRH